MASLFVEEVLKRAALRIADKIEGEENLTLAEFKRRPCGKATDARTYLHDDITAVIVDVTDTADESFPGGRPQGVVRGGCGGYHWRCPCWSRRGQHCLRASLNVGRG